jgi:hypothetical protein
MISMLIYPRYDYFTLEVIEGGSSPWPREEQRNLRKERSARNSRSFIAGSDCLENKDLRRAP